VALRGKVIDFVGLHFLNDSDQVRGICQISVVQLKAQIHFMRILIEMIYAIRIEGRGATLHPVDDVSLR
jgi:hypothetical protein